MDQSWDFNMEFVIICLKRAFCNTRISLNTSRDKTPRFIDLVSKRNSVLAELIELFELDDIPECHRVFDFTTNFSEFAITIPTVSIYFE